MVLLTRDQHRHEWMAAVLADLRAVRPDAVLVEMGSAAIDGTAPPAIASHGASVANARAVAAALGLASSYPHGRATIMTMEPVRSPQLPLPQRSSADSPRLLREINDHVVLGLLLAEGPMTRGRIGERTGLSKPTVSSLLNRLDERGLVTTTGVVEGSGPGPNARIYAVNPRAAYVIGVHVEQHLSIAGLATLTGEVIATHAVEVPQRRESAPIDEMTAAVDGVLAAASLPRSAVHGVIVATPGVIDPITGHLRHARHIKGWETPGLTALMTQTLGIPVSQGNDVNLAAVAEGLLGAARDRTDYALLWLDRGVGLGIVLGGTVRTGAHGGAGEIGYLPVAGIDHPRVDRGAAGGFQQLVGGQGMRSLAKRHGIAGR